MLSSLRTRQINKIQQADQNMKKMIAKKIKGINEW
jgi:hypothetical protein